MKVLDFAGNVLAEVIEETLQGVDLQGADLRGVDLRGANLRGADLEGAVLISGWKLERV